MTDTTSSHDNSSKTPVTDYWLDLRDDMLGSQRGYFRKPMPFGENKAATVQPKAMTASQKAYSDLLGSTYR